MSVASKLLSGSVASDLMLENDGVEPIFLY